VETVVGYEKSESRWIARGRGSPVRRMQELNQ
jgi:hypothetical protein